MTFRLAINLVLFNIYFVGTESTRLIQGVGKTKLSFYKVVYPFAANSTFTNLSLSLQPISDSNGSLAALSMLSILDIEIETLMGQNLCNDHSREAVGRLMTVLKQVFSADEIAGNTKSKLFLSITEHLLQQLCTEVVLDKTTYRALLQHDKTAMGCDEENESNVTCGLLGIGNSRKTWYGTPDGRCRGGNSDTNVRGPNQTSSGSTPGDTIEAKLNTQPNHITQIVGESVISSFIESNLHPELNPMIPSIIIDGQKFGVSIYDKENDLLLLGWDIPWLTENDDSELQLDEVGVVILWAMLHHR